MFVHALDGRAFRPHDVIAIGACWFEVGYRLVHALDRSTLGQEVAEWIIRAELLRTVGSRGFFLLCLGWFVAFPPFQIQDRSPDDTDPGREAPHVVPVGGAAQIGAGEFKRL